MKRFNKFLLMIAAAITVTAIVIWQTTGGDYYTKYEVVERDSVKTEPDDPLAAAGFYDGDSKTRTVTRSEFRFGLLPTPRGVFDKHALSLTTVIFPVWVITFVSLWFRRRRKYLSKSLPRLE